MPYGWPAEEVARALPALVADIIAGTTALPCFAGTSGMVQTTLLLANFMPRLTNV